MNKEKLYKNYIGLTFRQEIDSLIGTLDNTPWHYSMLSSSPLTLRFDTSEDANAAYTHIRHFLFSTKKVNTSIKKLDIMFIEKQEATQMHSLWLRAKRELALNYLFQIELRKLEKVLKSEGHIYHRHGNTFHCATLAGLYEVDECLCLFPGPRDHFGLLRYVLIDSLTIKFFRLRDVPN